MQDTVRDFKMVTKAISEKQYALSKTILRDTVKMNAVDFVCTAACLVTCVSGLVLFAAAGATLFGGLAATSLTLNSTGALIGAAVAGGYVAEKTSGIHSRMFSKRQEMFKEFNVLKHKELRLKSSDVADKAMQQTFPAASGMKDSLTRTISSLFSYAGGKKPLGVQPENHDRKEPPAPRQDL